MKDKNKEKCVALKKIRKNLAEKIGIDLKQTECTFQGKCSGTCPKCKQEEETLNKKILQQTVAASVLATMSIGITGCGNLYVQDSLSGDVSIVEEDMDNEVEIFSGDIADMDYENEIEKDQNETTINEEDIYENDPLSSDVELDIPLSGSVEKID